MNNKREITFETFNQENVNLVYFLDDVFAKSGNINVVCPDKIDRSKKMPDYYISPDKIITEVKRLYDFNDIKSSSYWGIIVNKLQKLVNDKLTNFRIDGFYLIETPRSLKISNGKKRNLLSEEILKSIHNKEQELDFDGYHFSLKKVSSRDKGITFSTSWGGFINPAGTIFQNLKGLLAKTDIQLENGSKTFDTKKRIFLLINNYPYADRISEVIEGLSYCYNDLFGYRNIDEIWLQQKIQNNEIKHTLIYSRDFITNFNKKAVKPDNKMHQEQFELWYWALDKMSNKQDELFNALKKFLERHKPEDIFPDKFKRETMVRLGIWLVENNRDDDAIWLIDKFINDQDPGEPTEYQGDEEFNYHEQLKNNEDPTIITTVMGHLAWTTQALARKSNEKEPNNLIDAYKFIEKVLTNTKNLYIVQQWMVPLVEIANRRWWILEKDINLYKRFRNLLLDNKKGLVVRFGDTPGIAKYMANIFNSFKDLTTKETNLVLKKICHVDQTMPVLIYFAIYRPLHYKKGTELGNKVAKINKDILDYSPDYSIKLLNKIISSTDKKYIECQGTIAWNFWKILEEDAGQLKNQNFIKFLNIMMQKEFSQSTEFGISSIIQITANHDRNLASKWLKTRLLMLEKYSESKREPVYIAIGDVRKKLKNTKDRKEICNLIKKLNLSQNVHINEMKL